MNRPLLQLTELCLVWGPKDLPDEAVSFADDWDTVIYTQCEIAEAILSVPNTLLIHDARPNWSDWRAQWRADTHTINFDIMEMDLDPDYGGRPGLTSCWGGSSFITNCTLEELLEVWSAIQKRCPAVWLHDTACRMYNPRSFVAAIDTRVTEWSR